MFSFQAATSAADADAVVGMYVSHNTLEPVKASTVNVALILR